MRLTNPSRLGRHPRGAGSGHRHRWCFEGERSSGCRELEEVVQGLQQTFPTVRTKPRRRPNGRTRGTRSAYDLRGPSVTGGRMSGAADGPGRQDTGPGDGGPEVPPDGEGPGRRVSTLELFFDLVFVFTLTQLTV